jgi:hypothetical protein
MLPFENFTLNMESPMGYFGISFCLNWQNFSQKWQNFLVLLAGNPMLKGWSWFTPGLLQPRHIPLLHHLKITQSQIVITPEEG